MKRIEYLDKYRFLTVTFALISHAVAALSLYNGMSESFAYGLKFATRSATPTLLILFGIMMEIVYYKKYIDIGSQVFSRLIYRSILCYLVFILCSTVAVIIGKKGIVSYLAGFLMLTPTVNSNIFLIYFFMLLSSIALLKIRRKYGFVGLFLMVVLVWLVDASIIQKANSLTSPFGFIGGLLFGLGSGPSVFHGLSLVILGMSIGNFLFVDKKSSWSGYMLLAALLFSLIYTIVAINKIGFDNYVFNITDIKMYRSTNDVLYYLYGFLAGLIIILTSIVLNKAVYGKLNKWINFLGANTFSYFVIGNLLLMFLPTILRLITPLISNPVQVVFYLLFFLTLTSLFTRLWEEKLYHFDINQLIVKRAKRASNIIGEKVSLIKLRRMNNIGTLDRPLNNGDSSIRKSRQKKQ